MGHRKELGHALFRIEESYLKLFEKLLEISLRMYWKYEQVGCCLLFHDHRILGSSDLPLSTI